MSVFFFSLPLALVSFSQQTDENLILNVSADLVSRYVWRGINLSESPAIQPTLSATYMNFTLGAWGSYTISREPVQEVDLFLTYETDFLTVTLNNYYSTPDTLGFRGNYFNLAKAATPHALEGMATLSGPEWFPLFFSAATMLWGNDRREDGKNRYSTYLEMGFPFKITETRVATFIGLTPANGIYGNRFGVVNLGISATRNIVVTEKVSIPIKGSFMVNPQQEKVFMVLSVTL